MARHTWLPEVAERAGFSIDAFPPVETAGAALGRVSSAGEAWSGLPRGVPVTLAGHDHLAGADGCGAAEEDLVNSVGTAETVIGRRRELPDVARAVAARVAVTVCPGGEGWATLASAARSGIVLERVAELLDHPPGELDCMAEGVAPTDAGEWLEAVERGEGPTLPVDPPGAVWNGVLEALSLRTRDAIRRTMEVTGPGLAPGGQAEPGPAPGGQAEPGPAPARGARLVVFGGGSRSRPWLSAKAACMPMEVWHSTVEEAARGAALRAGVAAGWWNSPADAPPPPLYNVTGRGVSVFRIGD